MIRHFPLILRNSLRNRRRSVLTVSSIAVSFCVLGVLMAVYQTLFYATATPAQALRLVTHNKVSLTQYLPVSYEQQIERVAGVRAVSRYQWFGGVYKDAGNPKYRFARFGVEPEQFLGVHPEIVLPGNPKLAFEKQRTACIAAKSLAGKLGWRVGERITLAGDMFPVTLQLSLVGVFDAGQNDTSSFGGSPDILYFNWDYLEESLIAAGRAPRGGPPVGMVHMYQVEAGAPDEAPRVAKAIDAMFANWPNPTKTETEQAFQLSFVSFLGNLKLFLAAICAAVMFTILLVSANTLSMSVRERIGETGILKTLGFTPTEILGIVLGEAGLIALAGGILGCIAAGGLCFIVRQNPAMAQFLKTLRVTPAVALLTLLTALFIGFAGALVPALGAARISIIDSLRHTG